MNPRRDSQPQAVVENGSEPSPCVPARPPGATRATPSSTSGDCRSSAYSGRGATTAAIEVREGEYGRASDHDGRDAGQAKSCLLLQLGIFVLTAAVIAIRDRLPLLRAEFWAEDATEFFFGAQALGARSLVAAVYGYHFLLSRVIAYSATFFPVLYTPYIYAWACLPLNALSVSYFMRDGFSWLISSRRQRLGVVFLLTVAPGTSDVFLNLAGLPIPLALLALLLLIERPFRVGWVKLAVLPVLILSSGQTILWLPVVAYLWWLTRKSAYAVVGTLMAVVAGFNWVGSHEASAAAGLLHPGALHTVPKILIENLFARLLAWPLLGPDLAGVMMRAHPAFFWTLASLGLGVLAIWALRQFRTRREMVALLGLAHLGAIASLGVVALSRQYSLTMLVREAGSRWWNLRYSVLPSATAIIIWCIFWFRLRDKGTRWSLVGIAWLGLHTLLWWPRVHPRPDQHWPARAVQVQALLDKKNAENRIITIQQLGIHPVGWEPNNHRVSVELSAR